MPISTLAVFAVTMLRHRESKSVCPQVGYLAEEIHGLLCIPTLQLSIGRTHSTHGLYLASSTLGVSGDLFPPYLQEKVFPTLLKTALAQIIRVTMGENAST
jgi:hypothetical protein